MQKKTDTGQNPNTPANWDSRWKTIGLKQADDSLVTQRLTHVANLIPHHLTILDLAAGAGIIRHKLNQPASYVPVDFSKEALKLCGVPGILAPCDKVPVPDHSFDVVLAMEILEHLDDPRTLIVEATRIARMRLIVTVPNNRLPPDQFAYHRRTWDHRSLALFLSQFKQLFFTRLLDAPANIIAHCILKTEDPRP